MWESAQRSVVAHGGSARSNEHRAPSIDETRRTPGRNQADAA